MTLAGRVAVVTGGGSGMGVAICDFPARDGAAIAVLDRNLDSAEVVASRLNSSGSHAIAIPVDVSDRSSVDQAITAAREALGPIDILVTSAGISAFVPFMEITAELWDQMMNVNLKGTFNCVQAVIPDMIKSGWGRVILISSSGAQSGAPNQVHYIASKGGVIAMTKALAVEFGPAA